MDALLQIETSLQRQVFSAIGADIVRGRYAAGDLIGTDEVGAKYDVSRTVIREAFRALEARGLIRARHRSGTRVQPSESWNLLDPDVISWRSTGPQSNRQLSELLVLREAIEPVAAALAAVNGTAEDVLTLRESAESMALAAHSKDVNLFVEADIQFHDTLIAASANAVMVQLLQTIDATLRSRYGGGMPVFTARTAASIDRHRNLAAAIADRDPSGARAEALALVQDARAEAMVGGVL